MTRSLLHSYEGQIKVFLVLLVLFLAVAIVLDFHLLVSARDAIQDEVGRRVALEAEVVRAELERDQLLRGLRGEPGPPAYIPPTFLNLMARQKGMLAIEILTTDGKVLSSSDPERVGKPDDLLVGNASARDRLRGGGRVIAPLDRLHGSRYATLAAYRPIQDRSRATIAVVRVLTEVPALGGVDFNLTLIAGLQAAGLVFILVLVILFARWLLQPYRRLLSAAVQAPGQVPGLSKEGVADEPDYLVEAFQGVLDKLRAQEQELTRLKGPSGGPDSPSALAGGTLVGGMSSAVLVFDRNGRLSVMNPAAERLLALDRSSSVGRKYGDLLGRAGRLIDLIEQSLRTGESLSREVVPLADPAGKVTHLGVMVSPIRPADGPEGVAPPVEGALCLLADLTEIKSLRDKVGLKENLALLGEMSAGIAHEFRNALATIHGLARLIVKGNGNAAGDPAAPREHAETILREVAGIEKVVTDFLRYARPMHLDLSEVDLKDVVDHLARDLGEEGRRAGIALEVRGVFPHIVADEALIRQAVKNLLMNALESFTTPPDGSHAPAEATGARRVVVRGEAPDGAEGGVRIVVDDNGPGISAEDLPRIFTPFFTTKERGTGLGLALVQKTAVVHDGQVEVRSEEGRGTTFFLTLPARPGGGASLPTL